MLFDSFVCSLRNLGRKRFRSFLTIASIAIGVASVVLIGSIGEIGKQTISDELNSLGLGSLTVIPDSRIEAGTLCCMILRVVSVSITASTSSRTTRSPTDTLTVCAITGVSR